MHKNSLTDEGIGYTVGFIVIVLFCLFIYKLVSNKKHKDEISHYCQQNGLKYTETAIYIPDCSIKFNLTNSGKNQEFTNFMAGNRNEYEFQIFDFCFYVETINSRFPDQKHDDEYNSTMCLLRKKGKQLPAMYFLDKELFDADKDLLPKIENLHDIELDGKESDEKIIVRSRNETEARQLFSGQRLDYIKSSFMQDFKYEIQGEYLLVSATDTISVKERLNLLDNSIKMFEAISN